MAEPPNAKRDPKPFQLGLCMAGAVSAGAYTAGALDFLIEALDAWEAARGQPGVPTHRVTLRAMSGASAGGMCAAILAAALHRRFPAARDDLARAQNPLWQAWVVRPSIHALLDNADLRRGPRELRSLFNVAVLQEIVDGVLDWPGEAVSRPWVEEGLPLAVTVGNLRGVPFGIEFGGEDRPRSALRMHGDWMGFALGRDRPGLLRLDGPASLRDEAWRRLGAAALASGAFPLALRARALSRPLSDYAARQVLVPGDRRVGSQHQRDRWVSLTPAWPAGTPDPVGFLCADGGLFDNEPLELCRRFMLDAPGQRMARDGALADRCVVMIDPFPDDPDPGPAAETGLRGLALAVLEAWKHQARFGAADVALAHDPDVYSRMLVEPRRSAPEASGKPLAAGGLGAFLGFFHHAYRVHDFRLGRRNMQRFLRRYFVLPQENPIFAGAAIRPSGEMTRDCDPGFLPLVPLFGATAAKEELPDWPKGRLDPATLEAPIRARLDALVPRLIEDLGPGAAWAAAGKAAWLLSRGAAGRKAVGVIRAAAEAKGLA
jgi:predicted acylesterase/phospholipase RssA